METYKKIESKINTVKEWNQEAGNELHNQLSQAQNAQWNKKELSEYIKSENDIADKYFNDESIQHSEIREIQDWIISFYGEE